MCAGLYYRFRLVYPTQTERVLNFAQAKTQETFLRGIQKRVLYPLRDAILSIQAMEFQHPVERDFVIRLHYTTVNISS